MNVPALFAGAAVVLAAFTVVYVRRMAAGPTVFDRILGLNAFGTTTTVALLLVGGAYDRIEMFVDIALGYALLTFVGTLAAARYFERSGAAR